MEYIGAAVLIVFILYKIFGKGFFNKKLLESMVERIATPALAYNSNLKEEKVMAMYFYYACLIFTCQKRNLSKMTQTLVDLSFRKTLTDVFNLKELPHETYMNKLKFVFYIIEMLNKSNNHPEVLTNLIANENKKGTKFGWLDFDAADTFAMASSFYIHRVGPTVDFLLETSKHYPD